jgi:hypothetical protein
MPEGETLSQLQALDALASERNAILAFRVCEETDALEPVFLRAFRANAGEDDEAALISIDDQRGMSLGRYVIGRAALEEALAGADEIEEEDPVPEAVPLEWSLERRRP